MKNLSVALNEMLNEAKINYDFVEEQLVYAKSKLSNNKGLYSVVVNAIEQIAKTDIVFAKPIVEIANKTISMLNDINVNETNQLAKDFIKQAKLLVGNKSLMANYEKASNDIKNVSLICVLNDRMKNSTIWNNAKFIISNDFKSLTVLSISEDMDGYKEFDEQIKKYSKECSIMNSGYAMKQYLIIFK